ncbi:MAG: endo-1,4-beta-xylanase, partial [Verrucomicrobiae bacterium]|nr:endo-1,4-beta-xylanase [Verrucomicrobiae bacterium]
MFVQAANGQGNGTENTPYARTGPALAQGKSKFLGCAWSSAQETGFLNYWNQLVPENAGKWGSVEAVRDSYNWTSLDAAYHLAKDHGIPFRFHMLVWGSQQPGWITSLPAAEQLEELEEWISLVAHRYPDIDWLEVVNEPISAPAPYRDALGGTGETGWDWIINAFRLARQYFPDTQLMINEYGIVNDGNKRSDYMQIIRSLQSDELIDLVGVQSHAFNLTGGAANITNNLDGLATLGLPIMITELDVDGRPDPNPPDDNAAVDALSDSTQLERIKEYFPALIEHPAVIGVTFWGYRPGLWREKNDAHLVMELGAQRPAMEWLVDFMSRFETMNFAEYLEALQLDPEEHSFEADWDKDLLSTGLEYLLGFYPLIPNPFPA